MPVVILAKYYPNYEGTGNNVIEILSPLVIPRGHLQPMAKVAKDQGFDLMYEFSSQPDTKELARLAPEGKVSSMPNMVRLWVLTEEAL